jgi:hypothetical protein
MSDLAFRPASYWAHDDAVSAIRAGIKGQNRRRMVTDAVTGGIDPGLLEDALDEGTRERLGALHPSWMGGEYLPGYLPGEVEIARIVLASVMQDVISFRARRRRRGGGLRILYRVVDEYLEPGDLPWTCRPASSRLPLTLGQMIRLMDGARRPAWDYGDGALPDAIRDSQEGGDPEDIACFVSVESDFYPGLTAWYDARAEEWLVRKRREWEEDDAEEEP